MLLRDGRSPEKKRSLLDFVQMRGKGGPVQIFFRTFSRGAFLDNKGVHFFQNANNLNFKLCILSPKLTFKSWISHVRKKLYKLSKLGGGGVIWTKSKRKHFFIWRTSWMMMLIEMMMTMMMMGPRLHSLAINYWRHWWNSSTWPECLTLLSLFSSPFLRVFFN